MDRQLRFLLFCFSLVLISTAAAMPALAQLRWSEDRSTEPYRPQQAAMPPTCYEPSAQSLELDRIARENLRRLRLESIGQHARPYSFGPGSSGLSDNWYTWEHFTLEFEPEWEGDSQDLSKIPGSAALWLACHYYSISTLDFSPRLPELIASGFWPYSTFKPGEEPPLPLLGFDKMNGPKRLLAVSEVTEQETNTAVWLTMARAGILQAYYEDFFTPKGGSKENRPQPTVAELGSKCPAFWINPFSGEEMKESTQAGDFRMFTPKELEHDGWLGGMWGRAGLPADALPYLMSGYGLGSYDENAIAQPAFGLMSDLDRIAQINLVAERCRSYWKEQPGAGFVRFDSNGPRLPVEKLPAGRALELAAAAYATATLDFSVTPAELQAAGFWPYETMPESWMSDNLIYEVRGGSAINWYGYNLSSSINNLPFMPNSKEWLLWMRAQILNAFHEQYFFYPILQSRFPGDDYPGYEAMAPRVSAFWVNPLTDTPFASGSAKGELSSWPVSTFQPQYDGARLDYALEVPHINLCQKLAASPSGLPVLLRQYRSVDIEGTPQAVEFSMDVAGKTHSGKVSFVFDGPASRTEQVPMDDGWTELAQGGWPWAPPSFRTRRSRSEYDDDAQWGSGLPGAKRPRILFDELAPLYARASRESARDYSEFIMNLEVGQAILRREEPAEQKLVAAAGESGQ
ncbi:hypothetical protein IT575_00720 [bacterium]|nr:hypothetical protein [bacterium]